MEAPALDLLQQISPSTLHAPASMDDVLTHGVTFAKRWRWVESGLLWLGRDQLVGVLKEGKMDSSAPTCFNHILQDQARVAHARLKDDETVVHCALPAERLDELKKIRVGEAPPHRCTISTKTITSLRGPPWDKSRL